MISEKVFFSKKIILFFLEKSRVVNIFEMYSNKAKNIDIQFKDNKNNSSKYPINTAL